MDEVRCFSHLMVALPCEAKPLVAHYRLKRLLHVHPFDVYEGGDGDVRLTVSGLGKTAMAAATAYTQALFDAPPTSAWINVGIAGHRSAPLGAPFMAHQIRDADTGKSWYPPLVFDVPCDTAAINTVSEPQRTYDGDCLYEMESSGFYETACRFVTSELVHCIKIVSDNVAFPAAGIESSRVAQWIASRLELVDTVRARLCEAALEIEGQTCPAVQAFASQWRFSSQQRLLLRRLLWRWHVLDGGGVPAPQHLLGKKSAAEVLAWLEDQVEQLPVRVDGR